jgi:hypothetical protein
LVGVAVLALEALGAYGLKEGRPARTLPTLFRPTNAGLIELDQGSAFSERNSN